MRLSEDESESREFTYVDEIARGTLLGLRKVTYKVVNFGGDQPFDLVTLIRLIEAKRGHKVDIERSEAHAADVSATWADVSKAKRVLSWRPEVGFEKGVCRLWAVCEQNREWASAVDTKD